MRSAPLIVFLLLVVAFAIALSIPEKTRKAPAQTGLIAQPLPELSLQNLQADGAQFSPELLQWRITVLNIFASWCAPCEVELPEFAALKAQYPNIQIIGIGWHDSPENITAWVAEHNAPFDHIFTDPNQQIGVQLGIRGVPETFILDQSGAVRYHTAGPVHETLRTRDLAPLIQELNHE